MKHFLLLLSLSAAALSCGRLPDGGVSALPAAPVRFELTPLAPVDTRSMILSDAGLRHACTPVEDGGLGRSIGLWAAMSKDGRTVDDVFQGVRLQWRAFGDKAHEGNPDPEGTEGPGHESYWNTVVDDGGVDRYAEVYWHPGETYTFRAYYPDGVQLASNTNSATFIAEYNTRTRQEDLLAAYCRVHLDTRESLQQHVRLNLMHMLAALRLVFRFKDEEGFVNSDRLTGAWLENGPDGSFGDYALLVFGDGTDAGAEDVSWYIMDAPDEGVRMYEWSNAAGIPFWRTASASLAAEAYVPEGMGPGDTGLLYTGNGRYVYLIPQALRPGTKVCFTTENSHGRVFSVDFPTTFAAPADPAGPGRLVPGYRYTVNIIISRLDIDTDVSVEPWNRLDSSYTIEF